MAGSLAALKQDRLEVQIAEHGRLEQAAGGGFTHVDISSCPDISNEGVQVQACLFSSMPWVSAAAQLCRSLRTAGSARQGTWGMHGDPPLSCSPPL